MARNPWNGTVQKNLPALVKTMRPASCGLLDQLYAERLINREELFKLKSLDTEEERARELLTSSLPSKGPQSFDKFCDQVARCEGHQRLVHLLHAESARTIPTEAAVMPNGESAPPEMEQAASSISQEGDHRNRMLPVPAGESTVRFGHRKGAQPKRISFYVPPPCNSGFKAVESKVKSSCGTAGISKSNVKIVYESVDDDSGEGSVQVQPPQEGAHSVVFDEVMLVSMVLYGISAVEFELDAFIADVLSEHLNVPREAVSPKEALDGCCSVIVSLPFEAIVSLFESLDDPEKSFQLTKSLKAQIPNLSHVEVMMGNLCLPMPVLQPPQTREELVDAALHIPAQEHLQRVLACRLSEEDKVDVLKASCSKLAKNLDPVDSRSQSWKDDYLFYAAGAGQLEMCDALLEHGTHPGVLVRSDNRTLSAIHAAAQGDHVDIVTSLLTVGVPVNSTDNEQNTPLHWASWYGNYNTVEVLLKEGADPQSMNSCGYAPLHYAAACGNLKCISQLTEANAQIDSATKPLGLTPLHIAVQEHQIDAVQLLLNLKANPVACTKLGLQPIHLATWSGNHRCLKLLLEQGVGSRDESLLGSPMKLAEIQGHLPAVVGTVLEAMEAREQKKAGIVKDLEKTLDGVSNDVELLNNRCTHLTDESKKLQQEVSELASGLEAQEKEAEENKRKAAELEKTLTAEQDRLTNEVEEEKKKFQKLSEDVSQFEKQHGELEEKIANLEQTALSMQSDIEKLELTVGTMRESEESTDTPAAAASAEATGEDSAS